MKSLIKKFLAGMAALAIAGAVWVPCLHFFFARRAADFRAPVGLSREARQLASRHLRLWTEPRSREQELRKMRASNAEWDFMGRSFLVWSLANMGLREPAAKAEYLRAMDEIIDETLRLEKEKGMYFFLMSYATAGRYIQQPARSLFLDGEIALMLGARRALEEKPGYKALMTERLDAITSRWRQSPTQMLEDRRAIPRRSGRLEPLDGCARLAAFGRRIRPGPIPTSTQRAWRNDTRIWLRA